jgi:hypothetical protein
MLLGWWDSPHTDEAAIDRRQVDHFFLLVEVPLLTVYGMDRAVAYTMFSTQHSMIFPVAQILIWYFKRVSSRNAQHTFFNKCAYAVWTVSITISQCAVLVSLIH